MEKDNTKVENSKIKKQISWVVLCLSIALFIFTTFEFVYPVKAFLLGAFGLMLYPILLFTMLFCGAIISGRKFIYSVRYVVYLFLCFLFLICVLHIIFTGFNANLGYAGYLTKCFNSLYTPGGVVIGVFTYPITSLLHDVAGIVIYAIAFLISLYFVLNYLDGIKQNKIARAERQANKYNNFETISSALQVDEQEQVNEEEYDEVEEDEEEETSSLKQIETNEEDDIFIKDEDEEQDKEYNLAREKLGLIKREQSDEQLSDSNNTEFRATSKLFGQNETSQTETWQNRALNRDDKPQKFVYEDSNPTPVKANPLFERNKEYLKSLYEVNTDNTNPIINAEDYEDYKEKMRAYRERNSQPFKRELDVNQTLNIVGSVKPQEEDKTFGIEPNKKIQSFNEYISPSREDIIKTEESSVASIDGLEDFIKPINDFKPSPLNPNNFSSTPQPIVREEKLVDNFNNKNETEPFDTKKLSDGDISTSLGNTYNLPKNMRTANLNPNDYRQLEIMGTQKDKKSIEPRFNYDTKYVRPPIDLLETYINEEDLSTNHEKNIEVLEKVLDEFKIPAKVEAVRRGSAVTRYELHMPVGIPVRKIHQHASDIALALAAKGEIRIETPIKGKSAVGIEVPNAKIDKVGLKDIIASNEFQGSKKALNFALGKDIDGGIYCCDLASMPHLLVAGSTGSGKSVCLNTLILSFIYKTSPEDLRLLLVDPKRVEFAIFNGLPHLLTPKAITEPKKALNAFDWLINEMERRFMVFQECYVKNISEYNSQPEVLSKKFPKIPYIVLIVDELADLVVTTNKKELEEKIIRLTQKARAAGIHVILATQRPSVDIITGSIKINLPSRIAFAVTSFVDSKTILDQAGAEKLLGRGDMLYAPSGSEPVRVQGAFVDTPEVRRIVDFVKDHNPCDYDPSIEKVINAEGGPVGGASVGASGGEEFDSLMPDALKLVIENGQASISMLQRRFSIGFSRAARIIDQMEVAKFISSSDGSKPRTVYITMDDYNNIYGNN